MPRGHTKRIDLGVVNGKHFFNAASIGLSVEVAQKLTRGAKGRWGWFAYLAAAAGVLRHARPFRAEIRGGGEVHQVRTVQITVGNGRHYGGGLTVADDAAIDDGRLDLYSLEVDRGGSCCAWCPRSAAAACPVTAGVRALEGDGVRGRSAPPAAGLG